MFLEGTFYLDGPWIYEKGSHFCVFSSMDSWCLEEIISLVVLRRGWNSQPQGLQTRSPIRKSRQEKQKSKPFFFLISHNFREIWCSAFFLWIWNKKVSKAFTLQQHSNGKWTLWRCISYSRRVIVFHCHVSLPEGKALKQKHFGAETLLFRLIRFPFQVFWNNLCFSSSTSASIIQAAFTVSFPVILFLV